MTKIVCAVLTLLSGIFFSVDTKAEQVGDMNGDGQVGLEEAIIALQIVAGLEPGVSLGEYIPSTGSATAADVLVSKTFSNDTASDLSGLMNNVGPQIIVPSTSSKGITQGYHNGGGYVSGDSDLIGSNIKSSVIIFGVTGTHVLEVSCSALTDLNLPVAINTPNCVCVDAANKCADDLGFGDYNTLVYWYNTFPPTLEEYYARGRCETVYNICIDVQNNL